MALSNTEKMLVEAITGMINGDTELGLAGHKATDESNYYQAIRQNLEQQFRLDTIDLAHSDSICTAFTKTHSHRYITDADFYAEFMGHMKSLAVPQDEQEKASKIVEKMIKKAEKGDEKGWNQDLKGIKEVSQPPQSK